MAVLVGLVAAAVGVAVLVVAVRAEPGKFETPRWVVASMGGAFLLFGGWTAAVFGAGYDPDKPDAKLPSPAVQLAVLLPALACFAAPFHWIAFWPGPRRFETSVSLPFASAHGTSHGWTGRAMFGAGALLIDVMIVALVVTLLRKMRLG